MSTTSANLKTDTLVGRGQDNLLDDIEQRLRNFQPAVAIEKQELFGIVITSGFNALRAAAERVTIIENAAAAREKDAVEIVALVKKVAANEVECVEKELKYLKKDLRMTRNQLLYSERKLTGRYIIRKFEKANEIDVKKNTREEAWKEFLDKIEGTELHKTIIKCVDVGAVAVGESVELDEQTSDLNLRAAWLATRAYAALSARVRLHDDYESYHLPSSVPWSIVCLMRSISSASGLRYQRVIILGDEDTD
ncbi:hypothetical protein HK405_002406 [Cladochytrium tenue]|nr:hypothetical protein HK405_002406 [Cladochytrium tenue]